MAKFIPNFVLGSHHAKSRQAKSAVHVNLFKAGVELTAFCSSTENSNMPTLLAIESASQTCSVALLADEVLYEKISFTPNQHNELLLPMINDLLIESGKVLADIDAFAFGHGPGSFTGLRISAAIVQGLALSSDKPVISVSSLAVLAQSVFRQNGAKQVVTVMDARMGEVYWASYCLNKAGLMVLNGRELVCAPAEIPKLDVTDFVAAGDGVCYQHEIQAVNPMIHSWLTDCFATAQDVVTLAKAAYAKGDLLIADYAQPVYLKEEINWKKLPGRH